MNMLAPSQRDFSFARATVQAPLIPLSAFAQIRGLSQAAILECIEVDRAIIGEEHIAWAFNIATRNSEQRELRILSHLLTPTNRAALRGEEHEFGLVLNLIFSPTRHAGRNAALGRNQFIRGTEVQHAWSCGPDHVAGLLADEDLRLVRERDAKSGPNGSPQIAWPSIESYLKSHRWPHMESATS